MTKVKICGITNLADARLAIEMGADSLGFNFFGESPRYISPVVAGQIIEGLPTDIEKVGVFVNHASTDILDILKTTGLNAAQLHGDEALDQIRELRASTNLKLIKAFRVGPDFDPNATVGFPVDSILLDAYSKDVYGGTGESFEWRIAAAESSKQLPLYLAGGLTPENVAKAIRTVKPYAVDVASGVEITPGRKDPAKVEAFIANAKNA